MSARAVVSSRTAASHILVDSSGGSRMETNERLNSENLGLKLQINEDLRLMNTYLMKKSGL
jgi:hypothetical protein